jgi:hypothetical protein
MKPQRNKTTPLPAAEAWMTLPQAAKALGKHRQTVTGMCLRGELVGDYRAGLLFIATASVTAYLKEQTLAKRAA